MTRDGDALFPSTCAKKAIRQLFAGFSFQPPRGKGAGGEGRRRESKTPERENELLLRLAPRVDTGVGSDLFSEGTKKKRTQTHLVCFVFASAVPQCFLPNTARCINSPLQEIPSMTADGPQNYGPAEREKQLNFDCSLQACARKTTLDMHRLKKNKSTVQQSTSKRDRFGRKSRFETRFALAWKKNKKKKHSR